MFFLRDFFEKIFPLPTSSQINADVFGDTGQGEGKPVNCGGQEEAPSEFAYIRIIDDKNVSVTYRHFSWKILRAFSFGFAAYSGLRLLHNPY